MPNRSADIVYFWANKLGLRGSVKVWTKEEDKIVKKYFPTEGAQCLSRLPNRTKQGLYTRAKKLKIKFEKGKQL